jgi:arylsulfatase A-like enzyme
MEEDLMRRIIFFSLLLSLSLAVPAWAEGARKPNFLVILADDLGYGDLACCGARDMRTPHLDTLFARGMRFDNFYASCTVCSPTRAALLTGRYPPLVGVPGVIRTHAENNWGFLSADAVLLPALLKPAGYHCGIVGKWHLGLEKPNTPLDRGFDHFHGFLGDMMDDYHTHRRHGINYMRLDREEIDPKGHATDLFSDWAIDYLRKQKKGRPFFLYLAYNAPHVPIQPPKEWLEKVQKRQPGLDPKRAKLVALIEHLDHGIGRVLAALKESGLEEETVVVFTSDNGGQLGAGANNGPLRDGKGSMYEGGLKVPAAVAWPGHVKPGGRTSQVALTMDLFPTLLEAAGVRARHEIDGVSLLPVLRGKKESLPGRTLFFCRREGGPAYGGKTIDAVRRGDWKLVQNSPYGPRELFNLSRDPRETTDLSKRERKVFRELSAALQRQIQRRGAVPWQKHDKMTR